MQSLQMHFFSRLVLLLQFAASRFACYIWVHRKERNLNCVIARLDNYIHTTDFIHTLRTYVRSTVSSYEWFSLCAVSFDGWFDPNITNTGTIYTIHKQIFESTIHITYDERTHRFCGIERRFLNSKHLHFMWQIDVKWLFERRDEVILGFNNHFFGLSSDHSYQSKEVFNLWK